MSNDVITQKELTHAKKVLSSITIFSQPNNVIEINRELRKSDRDFGKINSLVSKDVALSAKVIKLVNTSFFDFKGPVDSTQQAINLVIKSNLFKSVIATSLRDALEKEELGKYRAMYEEFWSHSELVSAMSGVIARRVGVVGVTTIDQALMAGLFHDCGVPIMVNQFSDYIEMINTALNGETSAIAVENDRFDTNHCDVGYVAAQSWALPEPVCQTIRVHHDADIKKIEDPSARRLSGIVMMAEHVTLAYGSVGYNSMETEEHWVASHMEVMKELDLNLSDLQDLKEEAFELLA